MVSESVHHVSVVDLVNQRVAIEGRILPLSEFVNVAMVITPSFNLIRMGAFSSPLGISGVLFVDRFLRVGIF